MQYFFIFLFLFYSTKLEELRYNDPLGNFNNSIIELILNKTSNTTTKESTDTMKSFNFTKAMTDAFLTNATSTTPVSSIESKTNDNIGVNVALIIYALILIGCVITAISKILLFYKICMNSSKAIHNEMFSCVLHAPMRFFDKQTSGKKKRIIS